MFEFLHNLSQRLSNGCVLRSCRWQRRKSIYLGKKVIQWQDPLSLHWYSENTALRLVRVRVLDELNRK